MKQVTQYDESFQVFDTSSLGHPVEIQQQPNSSYIHHSTFTTSVTLKNYLTPQQQNTVMINVRYLRMPSLPKIIQLNEHGAFVE
jgi:uncharacterized membrane-anchored protein YitT (DUF2179 family)